MLDSTESVAGAVLLALALTLLVVSTWGMVQGLSDIGRVRRTTPPPQHQLCVPRLVDSGGGGLPLLVDGASSTEQKIKSFSDSSTVVGRLRAPDDPRMFLQAAPGTRIVQRSGNLGHIWTNLIGSVAETEGPWRMVSFGHSAELFARINLASMSTTAVSGESRVRFTGPVTGAPRLLNDGISLGNCVFRWHDPVQPQPVEASVELVGTTTGGEFPHLTVDLKFAGAVSPAMGAASIVVIGSFDFVA